jgi:membrane associated rhomboid family serine protease
MAKRRARIHHYLRRYPGTLATAGFLGCWYVGQHVLFTAFVASEHSPAWYHTFYVNPNHPLWLLTYPVAFLSHASLPHLGTNLLGILLAGLYLERIERGRTMVAVFVTAGLLTVTGYTVLSTLIGNETLGMGSSGGVYGLYGAALVYGVVRLYQGPDEHQTIHLAIVAVTASTILDELHELWVGESGFHMSTNAAHVGGALIGAWLVVGLLFRRARKASASGDASSTTSNRVRTPTRPPKDFRGRARRLSYHGRRCRPPSPRRVTSPRRPATTPTPHGTARVLGTPSSARRRRRRRTPRCPIRSRLT